jgi:HlyD family secretion protein
LAAIGVVGAAGAVWLLAPSPGSGAGADREMPTFTTRRGPLTISVPVSGTIRSEQARVLESQVEGNVAIVQLVDEGTRVKQGDLLVQLDTSELEDEKRQAELELQNAQAAYVNAQQTLEITRRQGEADITAARVNLELARLDLQKYLGTAPGQLNFAELDLQQYFNASPEQVEAITDNPVLQRIKRLNHIPLTPADQRIARKVASLSDQHAGKANQLFQELRTALDGSDYRQRVRRIVSQANGSYGTAVNEVLHEIEAAVETPSYDEQIQAILDKMEGQYKQNVQAALNKIRIAEAELTRTNDKLEGSRRLASKGYITERELEADELEQQRRQSELQQARGELRLLRRFTFQRNLADYQNGVEQQRFELEKARHAKDSNIIDAEADLASKKEQLAGERSHLDEIKEQIEFASIEAPTDGIVVYAERDNDEAPLDTGVQVREREDLIRLPTADQMVAEVEIHESMVRNVDKGLPAEITTDAIAGETFTGTVSHVAIMPDRGHRWLNPDRRVYKSRIAIDPGQEGLRPGMSCNAEIIVKRMDDVTYVPLQAVVRVNGQPRVYLPGADGPQPRDVEVGLDNNKMVRITSGLSEGESVILTPPIPSAGRDLASAREQEAQQDKPQDKQPKGQTPGNDRPGRGQSQSDPRRSDSDDAASSPATS